MPAQSRARTILEIVIALLIVLALGGLGGYAAGPRIRQAMSGVTGEEALLEQIKGVGALLYLRLTTKPLDTAPYEPIRYSGLSPYGINVFLEQEVDPQVIDQSLALIADAGFQWIRQEFPWEAIEISAKGDYWDHKWDVSAWERYDLIVDRAEVHGLQVIARLDNPPAWSRAIGNEPGWELAPPDDLDDYGDFVEAVVARYKGRIRYYQIWNEPNIYPEWGDQPADPAAYVALLKVAYARAKAVDPDCVIIAAGLAQTTEETPPEFGPRNVSDLLFLERMYDAGLQGHFDVMGAQVYGLWTGPLDRRTSRDRSNFSRPQMLRQIMVQRGDADKPIWATEIGWNSIPLNSPAPPNYGRVSEEQQAQYAVQAYQRAAQEWPWMGIMNYWFFKRASDAETNQSWYYFRMLEPDLTPLPVYDSLSELANRPPAVQIGYHQEDHWALHYEGPWRHLDDEGAVLGQYALGQPGATLQFTFSGTSLQLALREVDTIGSVRVEIDGQSRRLRIPWSAPDEGSPLIPLASGLDDCEHAIRLTVEDGPLHLDGILVKRQKGPRWLLIPLALLIVAALIMARKKASQPC